jgi:hypothetical protein
MNPNPEIVFTSTLGKLICQVVKSGDGYVRQQIFPSGHIFEEDLTEKQYQDFLERVRIFDNLSS